jgi:hypothetical protein
MGIIATGDPLVISAASGIGGFFVWLWLSERNEQRRRKFDFTEKQLEELYFPLLGIRKQVGALSELRLRMASEFIVDDKSDRWKNELMPCYKEMLQIFQEKFWLAEDSTRERFQKLIVYIEIWERALNRAIPVEVIAWLNVPEAELAPLYEDLEQTSRDLRAKLA